MDAAQRLVVERDASTVNVSDLAAAPRSARGPGCAHSSPPQSFFGNVSCELAGKMHEPVLASSSANGATKLRLAESNRSFIRRTDEKRQWGCFIVRFAFGEKSMQGMWSEPALRDLVDGIEVGLCSPRPEQLKSSVAMMASSVFGPMFLVLEGHNWREAGFDTAELVLRTAGVARAKRVRLQIQSCRKCYRQSSEERTADYAGTTARPGLAALLLHLRVLHGTERENTQQSLGLARSRALRWLHS